MKLLHDHDYEGSSYEVKGIESPWRSKQQV